MWSFAKTIPEYLFDAAVVACVEIYKASVWSS